MTSFTGSNFFIVTFVYLWRICSSQAPPFLLQATPVPQIPFYYPGVSNVADCTGVNQGATYQPWSSHYVTPTTEAINQDSSISINFENPTTYPMPAAPIECTSQTQLRVGSCTTYTDCIGVMGGTINVSPNCPQSLFCCMLPTCALIVGTQTRYGHCRPKRTCPGIFDTVNGVSVGCSDPANSPCCVAEEATVTCPSNYDQYADTLVKTFGLLNTKEVASAQRVLAWAPFLLSAFDKAVGMCISDCHKSSFLQFFMNTFSEMLMFPSGIAGFYKQLLDWKGISKGLLPKNYFSYYSPYVFSQVIGNLFESYNLEQLYGARSLLSAQRIFYTLGKEIGIPMADYTSQFTSRSWQSCKMFAKFYGCSPAVLDGSECSNGQGLCFLQRPSSMLGVIEYDLYCSVLLPLKQGDCAGYPPNTVCCEKQYPALKYGANLVKNEFHDVVIAVHQVYHRDSSIISDLVDVMKNASAALYRATGGRAYFRTVTVLSQWNGTHGNATHETFKNSDIKVVPEYLSLQPRALQLGTCGEPGQGVFVSQNQLKQTGAPQALAKMFSLNRWGIGDEVASSSSEFAYVPDDQIAGSASLRAQSSCSAKVSVNYQPYPNDPKMFDFQTIDKAPPSSVVSFAFRPDIYPNENAEFCATTNMAHCDDTRKHNAEPNTPHNRICNRTSTMSAILRTADFGQSQNSPRSVGNTVPTFRFVQYPLLTDYVIAIVADFSGSISPRVGGTMVNAMISFLQIAPDEIKIVLVSVSSGNNVEILTEPVQPLEPFVQPTGGLHVRREWLIERAKSWIGLLNSARGPRNTSVLLGVETLVDHYLPKTYYRLQILVLSDFLGVEPTDNGLLKRIQRAGYSVWPVALWPRAKVANAQQHTEFPLYDYFQLMASSTYGRWQFIANSTDLLHWKYALASFLDDLNLGMSVLLEKYQAKPGDNLDIFFSIPSKYSLNTSIVVNYESYLLPVTIGTDSSALSFRNCTEDSRGYQKFFRVVCRLGDLTATSKNQLSLKFGTASKVNGTFEVIAWVIARAVEYGAKDTGSTSYPNAWDDPWQNRVATAPDQYVKGEAKLTSGLKIVFEKSEKFRFPRVYAIISSGRSAVLNCYVEYDLYMSNSTSDSLVKLTSNNRLYDDGTGEDGFANDGVYTALLFQAKYNGTYSVHVRVKPEQGSLGCYTKPSAAIVGYANNLDALAGTTMSPTPITFYKAAGSFDLSMPLDAINVFPLGLVRLQSCNVKDVVLLKNITGTSTLPKSMVAFCNVYPLTVASRYNLTITYYLSVSYRISDFADKTRYGANSSFTLTNATTFRQETFQLPFNITEVTSPYYYVVVWATDGKGNYATRSEIIVVTTPTSDATTARSNLPVVDDITTSWPPADEMMPGAIIFSCVAGAVLALALIVTIVFIFKRREKSRKMWSQDGNQVFMPSMWPVATNSRQYVQPKFAEQQQRPLRRPLFPPPGGRHHRQSFPNMDYIPGVPSGGNRVDWPEEMTSKYLAQRQKQRQRQNEEIFFPRDPSLPVSALNTRNDGTVERQNLTNAQLQALYIRATDGVNQQRY